MELVTPQLRAILDRQWKDQSGRLPPALKLFSPSGAATWLIHSAPPDDPDHLFGLCDLGLGFPELGYVSLRELEELEVPVDIEILGRIYRFTVKVERDLYFHSEHSLRAYAQAASHQGAITEHRDHLDQAELSLSTLR